MILDEMILDEMILDARRRMQEKDEEGAAHDICDKRPNHYLGAFFRKRWKGIYSFLNMNLLTTDHKPYRHLHHLLPAYLFFTPFCFSLLPRLLFRSTNFPQPRLSHL